MLYNSNRLDAARFLVNAAKHVSLNSHKPVGLPLPPKKGERHFKIGKLPRDQRKLPRLFSSLASSASTLTRPSDNVWIPLTNKRLQLGDVFWSLTAYQMSSEEIGARSREKQTIEVSQLCLVDPLSAPACGVKVLFEGYYNGGRLEEIIVGGERSILEATVGRRDYYRRFNGKMNLCLSEWSFTLSDAHLLRNMSIRTYGTADTWKTIAMRLLSGICLLDDHHINTMSWINGEKLEVTLFDQQMPSHSHMEIRPLDNGLFVYYSRDVFNRDPRLQSMPLYWQRLNESVGAILRHLHNLSPQQRLAEHWTRKVREAGDRIPEASLTI